MLHEWVVREYYRHVMKCNLPLDPYFLHLYSFSYGDLILQVCRIDLVVYRIRIHLLQFHLRIYNQNHKHSLKMKIF